MRTRVLAVDPGQKRLGLAISDPTGAIANPLCIIRHVSRLVDAVSIAAIAEENEATRIIVGQPFSDDGLPNPQTRHAERVAEAIKAQTSLPVELWDESESTKEARHARILMGVSRNKRKGHIDDLAATIILQSYLDAMSK